MPPHYRPCLLTKDLDDSITQQEREHVQQLVQHELATIQRETPNNRQNGPGLHPLVDQVVPLSARLSPRPMLLQEIERLDEEDDEPEHILEAVDLRRYADFSPNGDGASHSQLYTALSYAVLLERNALVLGQNEDQLTALQKQHLAQLAQLEDDYEIALSRKRQQAEDLNVARKKRQTDFGPVNDYLNDRWREGIRSVVDLGVETARVDLEHH